MKLEFPVQPVHVNQPFGANYDYYHTNFGTNGHIGIDFAAVHGQPVYAAHAGTARYVGPDAHGGDGVWIRTNEPDADGKYYTTIYWHLIAKTDPQFAPLGGNSAIEVNTGDLIGYADNTGAPFESSGDHLHFGLLPITADGQPLDPNNGFQGCIDPAPYLPQDTSDVIKAEVQVLNQTTDPSVRQSFIQLIIKQIKDLLGIHS